MACQLICTQHLLHKTERVIVTALERQHAINKSDRRLAARLNPQAQMILGRIGGIILVAIAVQLLASGIKGLFPILAG